MTDKLKPCPFCGGEAFEYYSGSQFEICEVVCKECGCRSKRKTEDEAIKAWNTRKPMDRIVGQLEALAEEADNTRNTYLAKHDWLPVNLYKGRCNAFDEAIEIVKGGAE